MLTGMRMLGEKRSGETGPKAERRAHVVRPVAEVNRYRKEPRPCRASTCARVDGAYYLQAGTQPSPHLPVRESPERQVAEMSVYTLFRYVRFHGGKQTYFTWHEEDAMPIVIVSPVTKLREGPVFAFAARWALI